MRRMLVVLTCLAPFLANAAPREDTWMSVTLGGRKIGHMLQQREERGGNVITTQTLDVKLDRAGISVALVSSEVSEETADGKPLGFSARSQMSGMEMRADGKLDAQGQVSVTSTVGGQSQTRSMAWPQGALLAEGLRLHGLREGLKPGTQYSDLAFQPSGLDAVKVDTKVNVPETVDLPGGRRKLHRLEQTLQLPGVPAQSVAWVDEKQNVQRLTMDLLGFQLEMLVCDRACATAPNQSADMLQNSLLAAPRALTAKELHDGLRYTLAPKEKAAKIELPSTDEQRVRRDGDALHVEIAQAGNAASSDKPVTADRESNAWLQSDAKEVAALAQQAAGSASSDTEKMRALEAFVRGYIKDKNLSVGYASALEVVKTREGDCTEHAVLLAALGRALNIPTRVIDGLAYTGSFAGAERVFVPHAWVQAWVEGRWQSFDAALNGFDAGHIALSVGDGDPWRFYAGLSTLGNLTLKKVEALAAP